MANIQEAKPQRSFFTKVLICAMYITAVSALFLSIMNFRSYLLTAHSEAAAAFGLLIWMTEFFVILPTLIIGIILSILTFLRERKAKSIHFFFAALLMAGEFMLFLFLLFAKITI